MCVYSGVCIVSSFILVHCIVLLGCHLETVCLAALTLTGLGSAFQPVPVVVTMLWDGIASWSFVFF